MNYRTEYIDNLLLSGESSITLKTKMGEDYPTKSWELVLEDDEKEKLLVHLFQHAADHRYETFFYDIGDFETPPFE